MLDDSTYCCISGLRALGVEVAFKTRRGKALCAVRIMASGAGLREEMLALFRVWSSSGRPQAVQQDGCEKKKPPNAPHARSIASE